MKLAALLLAALLVAGAAWLLLAESGAPHMPAEASTDRRAREAVLPAERIECEDARRLAAVPLRDPAEDFSEDGDAEPAEAEDPELAVDADDEWVVRFRPRRSDGTTLVPSNLRLTLSGGAAGIPPSHVDGPEVCVRLQAHYRSDRPLRLAMVEDGSGFEGAIDLARPQTPEAVDLGELVLHPAALLASGVVVDDDGEPRSDVQVMVRPAGAARNVEVRQGVGAGTDALGRFSLHGPSPAAEIAVAAYQLGRPVPSDWVVCAPGTRDLRIVLAAEITIRGRVAIASGRIPFRQLTLRCSKEPSGIPVVSEIATGTSRPEESAFVLHLRPGTWTCEVLVGGFKSPLATIAGIAVARGAAVDPRLLPVDLRHLHAVEVNAESSEAAKTLRYFRVESLEPVDDRTPPETAGFLGKAVLLAGSVAPRVRVSADAHDPEIITAGRDPNPVVLRARNDAAALPGGERR